MIRLLYLLLATAIILTYVWVVEGKPHKITIGPPTKQTTSPSEARTFMRECGYNATISRKGEVFFVTCREK